MLKEPQTEGLIAQLFDNQPDAVVWYRPVFEGADNRNTLVDLEVQYANQATAQLLGSSRSEVIGGRLRSTSLLDQQSILIIFTQCQEVWKTGVPVEHTYYSAGFDKYFNVQRSKVQGGILSITRDRTREVKADLERREQEKIFQEILDTAADGIMYLKAVRSAKNTITDFRLTHCNRRGLEIGQFSADAVGKKILELLPHLTGSEQFRLHCQVTETGEPVRFETTFRTPAGSEYGWFIVSLTKLGDGVISNFVDVSEKKRQEQELIEQRNLLNNILDVSLAAVYTCEAVHNSEGEIVDLRFVQVNRRFKELSVRPGVDVIGKNLLDLFPDTRKTETLARLSGVIQSGVPAHFEVHYQSGTNDGWYDTSAVKLGDNSVVVTFANITEQKKAALQIGQQQELLNKLMRHSPSSISVIEAMRNENGEVVDFRNVLVNDLAEKFTGVSKQDLLTKTNTEIDPAFTHSPAFQALVHTLQTGDPSYTDYRMVTGKWIEGAVSRMDEDHLVCIVTDVTIAKESELRMKALLTELKRSNESLEQFSSAASHDLKEPIRKVAFFVDRLKAKLADRATEEETHLIDRIVTATARMKLLVDDLLEYSHVGRGDRPEEEEINLNSKIGKILSDLELLVAENDAVINVGPLPVVKGYRRQLQQLFQNLISNALKYRKPGVPPVINIRAKSVSGEASGLNVSPADREKMFHLIEIEDNGIGFEQEYAEQIFHMFSRLHGNREYTGTGIGLAIAKKVMENHNGYIWAEGKPGLGATFRVLLPAR